jgi:hypothetical protein
MLENIIQIFIEDLPMMKFYQHFLSIQKLEKYKENKKQKKIFNNSYQKKF